MNKHMVAKDSTRRMSLLRVGFPQYNPMNQEEMIANSAQDEQTEQDEIKIQKIN